MNALIVMFSVTDGITQKINLMFLYKLRTMIIYIDFIVS